MMIIVAILTFISPLAGGDGSPSPEELRLLESAVAIEVVAPNRMYAALPFIVVLRATRTMPSLEIPTNQELRRLPSDQRQLAALQRELQSVQIPLFGLLDNHPLPLTVEITDNCGQRIVQHGTAPISAYYSTPPDFRREPPMTGVHRPFVRLSGSETKTFVVDLSPWMKDLAPGDYAYNVRLHNGPGPYGWTSQQRAVNVVAIDASVQGSLARILSEVPAPNVGVPGPGWLDRNIRIQRLQAEVPEDVFSYVAPYLFLNGAARTGVVALAPLDLLEGFPHHLAGLADVLRYEVLSAIGNEAQANMLHRSAAPSVDWQFDRVDEGDGLIEQGIRLVQPWAD